MIHNKLEIRYVMHSLNELEKLKLLLFDENQYFLFEHIPKPFLINGDIIKKIEEKEKKKEEQKKNKEEVNINVFSPSKNQVYDQKN